MRVGFVMRLTECYNLKKTIMRNNTLYTIGYAGKDFDYFVECLKKHNITCLVDVRTSPFSSAFPIFNGSSLKERLKKENILYVHFGKEFGARRDELEAYSLAYDLKGKACEQVNFQKVYQLDVFKEGLGRIEKALEQGHTICFMCSEKRPVNCHRFWMVGFYYFLQNNTYKVMNIISLDEIQTAEETIAESTFIKDRDRFYKEHDELNEFSLVPLKIPAWVSFWDSLFNSDKSDFIKVQEYSNALIGYSRGEEEND